MVFNLKKENSNGNRDPGCRKMPVVLVQSVLDAFIIVEEEGMILKIQVCGYKIHSPGVVN